MRRVDTQPLAPEIIDNIMGNTILIASLVLTNAAAHEESGIIFKKKRIEQQVGNDVMIEYEFVNTEHVVCVNIENIMMNTTIFSSKCFALNSEGNLKHHHLKLSGVAAGTYSITLFGGTSTLQRGVTIQLEVQQQQEIRPSYNWQPLHAWQTIPSGLETRLPLSDDGVKECRIPEPWQLQVAFPHPCKYFFRLNIYRNTKIQDILSHAAVTCNRPLDCFSISAGSEILQLSQTAESSDLFNAPHVQLIIAEKCKQ